MPNERKTKILGVPLDLGQSRRGVDMGPSAIRAACLAERLAALSVQVEDSGDAAVVIPETRCPGEENARYLAEIAQVCQGVARSVESFLDEGWTPLTLGGDHSIAVGALLGAARSFRKRGERLGLIWFDAHSDLNTPETSPSGNVHGMPLAYALGAGSGALAEILDPCPLAAPRSTALVGVRDVDPGERRTIESLGVRVFTMRAIDESGLRATVEEAIRVASEGTAGFHVSLDMDFVDPREAPGVGTPKRGGVTYREAHLAMELVADSGAMRSMDVVEVNPILDIGNQTAELAVELVLSAFGKSIV